MGRLDVERMLGEMTPEDFARWQAFATLRPFGVLKRAEQQAALLAAQCVEVEIDDILRAWGFELPEDVIREEDVMSEEETEAWVCAAFGV